MKKLSKQDGQDFAVPKLEALWWVEGKKDPRKTPKSKWQWKILIRMPNFVSEALVEKAKKQVADRSREIIAANAKYEEWKSDKTITTLLKNYELLIYVNVIIQIMVNKMKKLIILLEGLIKAGMPNE